jgi:hypothetical protein
MSWQQDHAFLREQGWRRGQDGLWRHTPEIGGSFKTKNALALAKGEPLPMTEKMEAILVFLAEHPGSHTPNEIGFGIGVAPRGGAQYRSRGPGSIIAGAITSLERRSFVRHASRRDGWSGSAYRITPEGLDRIGRR